MFDVAFLFFGRVYLSNTISISDGVRVAYKLETFMIPNGVIKIHNLKKDVQYNGQTKKDIQYNGQTKKDKRTSDDL